MNALHNPYGDNALIARLRPIWSREDALSALTNLPPVPDDVGAIPLHIRLHYVNMLSELHVPALEEAKLMDTVDVLLRYSYHLRNPGNPSTWANLGREFSSHTQRSPAKAAIIAGFSGTGKTSAIRNVLHTCAQVIEHAEFPMASKGLRQVVWISCDVPSTGKSTDLAAALMRQWDLVCQSSRFEDQLTGSRRKGSTMLDHWRDVASAQFLGIVHLDEVQNFFRSPAVARRRVQKRTAEKLELTLIEDECLKWFLNLVNIGQMAIICSGTPDGVSALSKRLATMQRFTTGGYHHFPHFTSIDDPFYRQLLLPQLIRYQFVAKPIALDDQLAETILEVTGGLLRIIVALWVAAHRVAFERGSDDLRLDDFRNAGDTWLAPLQPQIAALRSGDPERMRYYEDLTQQDEEFWASFWQSTVPAN